MVSYYTNIAATKVKSLLQILKKSLPPPRYKNKIFFCFVLFSFVFIIFSFFSVIDECVIYNLCNGAVASYQLEAINIKIKHNPNVKPNDVHVMAVKNKCIYLPFAYLIFIALSQKNLKITYIL